MIRQIPSLLVASRFLIAFYLLWDSRHKKISGLFLFLFCFAFFSDFLDGFLCRTFGGGSTTLTLWDGYADSVLYLSTFLSFCRCRPELLKRYQIPLLWLLFLQLFSWGFSLAKFGKITSYHTYGVKVWGPLILLALLESFVTRKGIFILGMVVAGSLCLFEDIAITVVMPYWKCCIQDFQTAVELKNKYTGTAAPRSLPIRR